MPCAHPSYEYEAVAGLQRLATATTARVPSCSVADIVSSLVEEDPAIVYTAHTVGVNKNWTLVFVNFSAQDASILKISVPIIKRRS